MDDRNNQMSAEEFLKRCSMSWRIMKDAAGPGVPMVIASARLQFGGNWNFVALLGTKMVEMAKQQMSRVVKPTEGDVRRLQMVKPQ